MVPRRRVTGGTSAINGINFLCGEREDFDQWRSGQSSCHRNAVGDAMQKVATDFNTVIEQDRGLPRTSVTREFPDMLFAATAKPLP